MPDRIFVFGGENRDGALQDCYLVSKGKIFSSLFIPYLEEIARTIKERKVSPYMDFAQYYNNEMYSDLLLKIIETDDDDKEIKVTQFYAQKSILGDRCVYFQ